MDGKEDIEAEQLDAYLAASQGVRQSVFPAPATDEIKLAEDLLKSSAGARPSPDFIQLLESRLMAEAYRRTHESIGGNILVKTRELLSMPKWSLPARVFLIAAGTLILALVVYFSLPLSKTGEAARLPSINVSAPVTTGGGSMFAGTEFVLQANLPDVPSDVTVYQQPVPKELALSEVRDLAGRFGFAGTVYQQKMPEPNPGSSGSQGGFPALPTIFSLFDGQRQFQVTNQGIEYMDSGIPEVVWSQPPLPFDQVESIARQYLTSRGLLDFSYRAVQDPNSANEVDFEVLAGQWPVASWNARVAVTPDRRIASFSYPLVNLKTLATYPIHSAGEAWTALQSGTTPGQWMQMNTSSPPGSAFTGPMVIWGPEYTPMEYVEIMGSVEAYLPVSGENAGPRLDLGPGNPRLEVPAQEEQSLIDTNYRLLLLWGRLRVDDSGGLIFEVAGWKDASEVPMKNVQGVIMKQKGRVLFRQADGQLFNLPLAPQSLTDDIPVSVSAWDTNRSQDGYPVLGWNSIETPPQPVSGANPPGTAQPVPGKTLPGGASVAPVPGAVTVVVSSQVPQVTVQPGNPAQSSPVSGKAYVDKVELVYVVTPGDPQSPTAAESIIQPAWRFFGSTESGAKFEILFQAVLEKYLN